MKVYAIIQARMGSERLPGKVLEKVGRLTVLEWVLWRLVEVEGLDGIVVATTPWARDNPIAALCSTLDVPCHRGSENDVLRRYVQVAEELRADAVVRVTADCPLLCPDLVTEIHRIFRADETLDYVGVTGAPVGFGQEIISTAALRDALDQSVLAGDREHVVTYTQRHGNCEYYDASWPNHDGWRLTIDTQHDLDLLRVLYDASGRTLFDLRAAEIIRLVEGDAVLLAAATKENA